MTDTKHPDDEKQARIKQVEEKLKNLQGEIAKQDALAAFKERMERQRLGNVYDMEGVSLEQRVKEQEELAERHLEQDGKVAKLVAQAAEISDIQFNIRLPKLIDQYKAITGNKITPSKFEKFRRDHIRAEMQSGLEKQEGAGASDDFDLLNIVASKNQHFKYVGKWKKWIIWNGKRWVKDEGQEIIQDKVRQDLIQHVETPQGLERKEIVKIKKERTVASIEKMMRGMKQYRSAPEDWDTHNWHLNTPEGVIDLKTGAFEDHTPERMITNITHVAPGGSCETWLKFLDQITDRDEDLIAYLQRLMGYCLTGDVEQQMFAFLYGSGANGKSTFLNVIQGILGPYAGTARSDILMEGYGKDHPAGEAALMGKRLVITSELSAGKSWDEGRLKSLTGGEPISARFMRGNFFDFMPHFKLVIAGNNKPTMRNIDEAMLRRLHLVPFNITIPEEKRNPELKTILRRESGGILQWMVDGCVKFCEEGLNPPPIVKLATQEYFDDENTLESFIQNCCATGNPNYEVMSAYLYKAWRKFCDDAGERAGTQKAFSVKMKRLFKTGRSKMGIKFYGITVSDNYAQHVDGHSF